MNMNDRELLEDLRALGSEPSCQAPARVEEKLLAEFRRRSRLRRARTWMSAAAIGVIAAAIALLVWIGPRAPKFAAPSEVAALADDSGFYPLPEADALPPLESALVVRVQLPLASLQLIGFPINEERAADRVEADLLLGQDGLARGVRLVE